MTSLSRRSYLKTFGSLAVLGAGGGCLGAITGEEAIEFEASPTRVSQDALDETGFRAEGVEEVVIEREFEAAGQTREVVVTNFQATYEKSIDVGPIGTQPGAVFTVLSTPQVNVLGREFNPVSEMDTDELAEMVQDQYEGIDDLDHVGDDQVTIGGETTTQSKFRAEGTLEGEPVDLNLHVSRAVEMGDDFVLTVGGYPEANAEEEDNVLRLTEAVEPDD